jgi:hypothetical protein
LVLHDRDPDKLGRTASAISESHGIEVPRTIVADLSELARYLSQRGVVT